MPVERCEVGAEYTIALDPEYAPQIVGARVRCVEQVNHYQQRDT
jgi:hypothetical protein